MGHVAKRPIGCTRRESDVNPEAAFRARAVQTIGVGPPLARSVKRLLHRHGTLRVRFWPSLFAMPTLRIADTRYLLLKLSVLVDELLTVMHRPEDRELLARHARTLHHALYTLVSEAEKASDLAAAQLWLKAAARVAKEIRRSLADRWGYELKPTATRRPKALPRQGLAAVTN